MDIYVITRPLKLVRRAGLGREVGRGLRGIFFCSWSFVLFFFLVIAEMDFVTCGYLGLRWTQPPWEGSL